MDPDTELYHALDPGRREFRLVRIQYDGTSEIECHLQIFSLNTEPVYTALSYCWTKERPTRTILLNGETFFVRPNLHEYLKQMRAEQHSGWMFIDAICINQKDNGEKTSQISVMGSVFGSAKEVVAWQGVEAELDPDLWESLEDLNRDLEPFIGGSPVQMSDKGTAELERDMALVFATFFQKRYWSRLWIAQEAILSRCLTIRFRGLQLSSEEAFFLLKKDLDFQITDIEWVDALARLLHEMEESAVWPAMVGPVTAWYFLSFREAFIGRSNSSRSISLPAAIKMLANQECLIRHDRIYGLLGLTRSLLVVKYALPVFELYLRVYIEGLCAVESELEARRGVLERRVHLFSNLTRALRLSPWHPVVAFTTMHCLELHRPSRVKVEEFYGIMAEHGSSVGDDRRGYDNKRRFARLRVQLRLAEASRFRMRGPGEYGRGRTPEEWAKMVECIFTDVENQMRAIEAKTAESEAASQERIQSSYERPRAFVDRDTISGSARYKVQDEQAETLVSCKVDPALEN